MYYYGYMEGNVVEIFYSHKNPTRESHGDLYLFAGGPKQTRQQAEDLAHYLFTNIEVRQYDGRKHDCKVNHNLFKIAGIV